MAGQKTRQLVVERGATCNALTLGVRYAAGANNSGPLAVGSNAATGAFFLEPDDYIGTKLRLRMTVLTNAVAPVSDYSTSLVPITAVAGGAAVVSVTVGTAIVNSSATIAAPGANTLLQTVSSEFDWPSAGWYLLSVGLSANATASSASQVIIQLEAR